jgi:carbon storage regulator CsrA
MLVLSRKPGESIEIDGPCKVTFIKQKRGGGGTLGFEAADDVIITRTELLQTSRRNQDDKQSK